MDKKIIDDITKFIFVSDEPMPSDAIFVPGDSHTELPEYAARLYGEGFAPIVIPSGNVSIKTGKFSGVKSKRDIYSKDYRSECEFFTDVLVRNGVPESAVIGENRAGHTRDNAFLTRELTDRYGLTIKSAIIICKSFHARRCLMLYQLAFPDTVFQVCTIDIYGIARDNWFKSELGIDRVFGELARCGNQFTDAVKAYLL